MTSATGRGIAGRDVDYSAAMSAATLDAISRVAMTGGDGPVLFRVLETIDALAICLGCVMALMPAVSDPARRREYVEYVGRRIDEEIGDVLHDEHAGLEGAP